MGKVVFILFMLSLVGKDDAKYEQDQFILGLGILQMDKYKKQKWKEEKNK